MKEVIPRMSEFNTFEFVVDERPEGIRKLKKILGRITVIAVPIIVAIVLLLVKLYPVAVVPLLFLGVILFFWKLFNVELEYSMTSGIMTFSRIYGSAKRRKVLEFTIKEAIEIAPRTPESDAKLQGRDVEKTYMFASHSTAADQYYALVNVEGKLSVVYFEATEKTLKILRYYNPVTVVTQVSR